MSIKNWNEDDRPREKFYLKGKQAVSDSELLAILIGMGTSKKSALDIARDILADNQNSIQNVSQLSVKDLTKYSGIGEAKAITIAAALEPGNRKQSEPIIELKSIKTSADIFQLLYSNFAGLKQEEFYFLLFNRSLKLIKKERLSIGRTDATLVDIKLLSKSALENLAHYVVVAHNHPSGNLTPSESDDKLTLKIKEALALFEIKLIDHIIISENKYYSYADESDLI